MGREIVPTVPIVPVGTPERDVEMGRLIGEMARLLELLRLLLDESPVGRYVMDKLFVFVGLTETDGKKPELGALPPVEIGATGVENDREVVTGASGVEKLVVDETLGAVPVDMPAIEEEGAVTAGAEPELCVGP